MPQPGSPLKRRSDNNPLQSRGLRRNVISQSRASAYVAGMLTKMLLAALSLAAATSGRAETQSDVISASVLPGWRTQSGTHMAALQLDLAPNWKTYWRAPGDAGIPPMFDWSGSENLKSVQFHWPRPGVFTINGMRSIGYYHQLVLPMEFTAKDASLPIHLQARIDLGICRDICMPAQLEINADLPAKGTADASINAALHDRPATGAEAGLTTISCSAEPLKDGLRVTARLALPHTGGTEVVVLEPNQPGGIWVSDAEVTRSGSDLIAVADLVPGSGTPFALDRSAMTVTVLGDSRAVEIHGCPSP